MKDAKWDESVVKEHLALLEEIPMNLDDPKIGNGMRYHVLDIYIDEMERVGALNEEEDTPVELLREPLRKLAMNSPTKDVRRKAKEALDDERLPGNEKPEAEKEELADGEWGGIED